MRRSALIPAETGGGILMVLIVAAMAFLTCFALAAALGASRVADAWTEGLAGAATVRISAENGPPSKQYGVVVDILKNSEGVLDATPLSDEEVADMLTVWFGGPPDMEELPAPGIIAVTIDPKNEPDPAIIQARLDGAAAGVVYDDHGRWRNRAASAAKAVRSVAIGALIVCTLAIAAVVILTVRTGLEAQQENIATLRLAGAEDRFVAGLYQKRYLWVGLLGGMIGCGLAFLAILLFDAVATVSSALPSLSPPPEWPFMLLGVVAFTGLISVIAARTTVMRTLRRGS